MADPTLPTIDDLGELAGRRVVVRCDLNVPLDGDRITDDGRIRASLPTLDELASAGARVVVLAHLGRPKGEPDPRFSLAPVAARLGDLLDHPVRFAARDAVVDDQVLAAVDSMTDGEVLVCENVRFRPEETSRDPAVRAGFAAELAALAGERGAYVDDAFGAVHRAHASVDDVARLLPHAAGALVNTELGVLRRLTDDPQRPYVVVLGGSKVSDKLAVIDALLPTVDRLLVGGGMCFTFLAAQGHDVGSSLLEPDQIDTCRRLLDAAGDRIVLPVDVVAATAFSADAEHDLVDAHEIPSDRMGLDIGPRSVELFTEALEGARTVFWNGPMGVFEMAAFAAGTRGVAEAVAGCRGLSVVGGGDSAAAVRQLGLDDASFGHISTGGGASLEFLEGKPLPGLTALERA